MPNIVLEKQKIIFPPWPYQTIERWKKAEREGEKVRNKKPFYPDFDDDVFAGFL